MTPIYSDREQKLLIFPNVEPGDAVTYRWTRTNSGAVVPLPTPPLNEIARSQHLLVSSFKDHEAFAHNYAAMVKGKIAVTPAIQKQADALAGNLSDKRAEARAIYDWVGRNVRYVAIELGTGGIIPHDPDWTLTNRYGDCKDHAVLLASLLKARGIDAQLVLINAVNRYKLAGVPTISDFNHMIAWLPGLDLYADTTMPWIPFGQLPPGDAGKPVLHVVESGTARHTTPVMPEAVGRGHAQRVGQRRQVVLGGEGVAANADRKARGGRAALGLAEAAQLDQAVMGGDGVGDESLGVRGGKSRSRKRNKKANSDTCDKFTQRKLPDEVSVSTPTPRGSPSSYCRSKRLLLSFSSRQLGPPYASAPSTMISPAMETPQTSVRNTGTPAA